MKTKIIPFDLETAKKIQAGKVEGRIVTYNNGEKDHWEVRLICFDRKDIYPIVGLIGNTVLCAYTNTGVASTHLEASPHSLVIELPEEEPKSLHIPTVKDYKDGGFNLQDKDILEETPKHEFKPFDRVLVRYPDKTELCVSNSIWIPGIFQYKSVNSNLYFVSGKAYKDCIPYEGNEHLVYTTNKPKED